MSLDNVKNIVLVLSGKGGVGKSSITTQLALSLSLAGKTVGVLDIDLTGPSIPRLFGIESQKIRQAPGGWLPVEVHSVQVLSPSHTNDSDSKTTSTDEESHDVNQKNGEAHVEAAPSTSSKESLHPEQEIGALHAISIALLLTSRSSAIVWRGPKKTAMVRQFLTDVLWPPLDYLLIDTPPGTSDEHISLVETLLQNLPPPPPASTSPSSIAQRVAGPRLAGAVLTTTPQNIATSDVRKQLNFCTKTGVPIIGVVENMAGYVCPCCGETTNVFSKGGGEMMSAEFGVKFLGSVPLDAQWGVIVEEGGWPKYEVVEGNAGDDSDSDEDEDLDGEGDRNSVSAGGGRVADAVATPAGNIGEPDGPTKRDPALLVDRYRACSLAPIFANISKQIIEATS
ncbi:cytosolic Fe-S cluster assembly factor cfd1 [Agyrium rufum]|nr:cytosolic Fe-S cluster assembly factor cfd1 [Agyrium rufum]